MNTAWRSTAALMMLAMLMGGCTSFRGALPGPMGEIFRPPATAKRIRVALALSAPAATVKVVGPCMLYDRAQRIRLDRLVTLKDTAFRADARGCIVVAGRATSSRRISIIPEMPQTLWINGVLYRGEAELVVNDSGALTVVNTLPLDEYLLGVIPKETFPSWPEEALRAQAVAARSFAAHHVRHTAKPDYDIIAPTHQLYGGVGAEDPRTSKAVLDTQGEVLTYRGDVLCAFFHTCCGGRTEEAASVFPDFTAYPPGVVSPYCTDSPHYAWRHSIATVNCGERLKFAGKPVAGPVTAAMISQRLASGRVTRMRFITSGGTAELTGEETRKLLGYDKLRSTWFNVLVRPDRIDFAGRGWGHGVGMCQWCSKGMADRGFSYERILIHFFADAQLGR